MEAWSVVRPLRHVAPLARHDGLLERVAFDLRRLRFGLPFIRHLRYSGDAGVGRGLGRYFKDPRLQRIFCSEHELLGCLVPIGWAYFGDYQSPPRGGSQVFPEWLCHVIDALGSEVQYRCRVARILLADGACCGVEVEQRGQRFELRARHVIAACDVETLYERMLPATAVPAALKARLRAARLYSSSVTVSLGLDVPTEELGFDQELLFLCREDVGRDEHSGSDPHKSAISILAPSLRDKSMAPPGMGTLTLYIPAFFEHRDRWGTDVDAQGLPVRGERYQQLKQQLAEVLIQRVERQIAPGLRSHIVCCEVATPITHWRYTGNRGGTMMGATPSKESFKAGIAHYRTPVPRLLLGGHWADLGGGVPIAVKSGVNTALIVLQERRDAAFRTWRDYLAGRTTLEEAMQGEGLVPYREDWVRQPTPAEKKLVLARAAGELHPVGSRNVNRRLGSGISRTHPASPTGEESSVPSRI